MKSSNLRFETIIFLLVLSLAIQSCGRNPKGEVYRSQDDRTSITFLSREELEFRTRNGTTLLCKYTQEKDTLRVILALYGTQQVLRFRQSAQGWRSDDGELFLAPEPFKDAQKQSQLAAEQKRRAQEAEAARLFAQKQRSLQSKAPTKVLAVFDSIPPYNQGKYKITISDTQVSWANRNDPVPFYNLQEIVAGAEFQDDYRLYINVWNGSQTFMSFKDAAEREKIIPELDKAVKAWNEKYSDVRLGNYKGLKRE